MRENKRWRGEETEGGERGRGIKERVRRRGEGEGEWGKTEREIGRRERKREGLDERWREGKRWSNVGEREGGKERNVRCEGMEDSDLHIERLQGEGE